MSRIGVAVAGTGFMGRVHVEALRRIDVDVVGILGSSPEKSRVAAQQLGLSTGYGSYDELLRDERVQAVHIGTPNRLHFEMARRALESGRHVLCEKPLAMTSAESGRLVEVARDHPDLAAGVNYNIRFYPLCIEAREQVRRGVLGKLLHVSGGYVQDWLLKDTDYNWRVLVEEGGSLRAVSDIGTHWLDLVQSITGLQVEAVLADLSTVHPVRHRPLGEVETFAGPNSDHGAATEPINVRTEDHGDVLVRFRGGARGSLHVSQVYAGRKNCLRLELQGSQQSLAWNSERPNELWVGHRDRPNEILLKDPALLSPAAAACSSYPGGHNEGYDVSFKQCFRAFYEYIQQADFTAVPPFATFAQGHHEIVLCEAILQSARESRWVSIH